MEFDSGVGPTCFFMPFHLDSNTSTDVKQEMLSGVKTRNGIPPDKWNLRGIALVRTDRKDNIYMQIRLVQGVVRRYSDFCAHKGHFFKPSITPPIFKIFRSSYSPFSLVNQEQQSIFESHVGSVYFDIYPPNICY